MERNIIEELGSLALATRLKLLSERLARDIARVYKEQDFDFEPRWFAVIQALKEYEELAVTELSAMLNQTHPAVNQVANILVAKELIIESKDDRDQRKRLLKLSPKGQQLVQNLSSLWDKIEQANDELLAQSPTDFLSAIKRIEEALDQKNMYDRVNGKMG